MERCRTKKGNIISAVIAIVFFTVGTLTGLYGYNHYIKNADDVYDQAIKNSSLRPIPIDDPRPWYDITGSKITSVEIEYQTDDGLIVNNPFNYTVTAIVDNPNQFDKIEAYPWVIASDMILPTTSDVITNEKKGFQYYKITLNRITGSDTFQGSKTNFVVHTEESLGLFLIPYTNGTARGGVLAYKELPLIIHPATEKLQADTNRNTLLQNIETAKSSSHVEGLTYVIIGLVFVALSFEIPIHRYLT